MADRTRDIVRLREAARLCRAKAEASGGGASDYVRLAGEIDGLIRLLSAENAMRAEARRAPAPFAGS
jgi:hypothetical protein